MESRSATRAKRLKFDSFAGAARRRWHIDGDSALPADWELVEEIFGAGGEGASVAHAEWGRTERENRGGWEGGIRGVEDGEEGDCR